MLTLIGLQNSTEHLCPNANKKAVIIIFMYSLLFIIIIKI